jgi:hypothetical protein
VKITNLLTENRMGIAAAGKPEESRMPDPVSSHTAAEHRQAISSLEGQPSQAAGHSRDHPPELETLRAPICARTTIIIQGNMR